MIEITWQEAESLLGLRVDRRRLYGKKENGLKDPSTGAIVYTVARWTDTCSGCFETVDGYPCGVYPTHKKHNCYVGAGCSECGYTGLRRCRYWVGYDGLEKEKEIMNDV